MTDPCTPDCTCRGLHGMLGDPVSQFQRRKRIAELSADQVECPFCYAGVGHQCLTFPRSKQTRRPHASRVDLRLAQIPVPTGQTRP